MVTIENIKQRILKFKRELPKKKYFKRMDKQIKKLAKANSSECDCKSLLNYEIASYVSLQEAVQHWLDKGYRCKLFVNVDDSITCFEYIYYYKFEEDELENKGITKTNTVSIKIFW